MLLEAGGESNQVNSVFLRGGYCIFKLGLEKEIPFRAASFNPALCEIETCNSKFFFRDLQNQSEYINPSGVRFLQLQS